MGQVVCSYINIAEAKPRLPELVERAGRGDEIVSLIHALVNLPFHHRDPVDRLLAAQAFEDDLTL